MKLYPQITKNFESSTQENEMRRDEYEGCAPRPPLFKDFQNIQQTPPNIPNVVSLIRSSILRTTFIMFIPFRESKVPLRGTMIFK